MQSHAVPNELARALLGTAAPADDGPTLIPQATIDSTMSSQPAKVRVAHRVRMLMRPHFGSGRRFALSARLLSRDKYLNRDRVVLHTSARCKPVRLVQESV